MKALKTHLSAEKDDAISSALEMQKHMYTTTDASQQRPPAQSTNNSTLVIKLQREIKQLKESKQEVEDRLNLKVVEESELRTEVVKLKKNQASEASRLKREVSEKYEKDLSILRDEIKLLHSNMNTVHNISQLHSSGHSGDSHNSSDILHNSTFLLPSGDSPAVGSGDSSIIMKDIREPGITAGADSINKDLKHSIEMGTAKHGMTDSGIDQGISFFCWVFIYLKITVG